MLEINLMPGGKKGPSKEELKRRKSAEKDKKKAKPTQPTPEKTESGNVDSESMYHSMELAGTLEGDLQNIQERLTFLQKEKEALQEDLEIAETTLNGDSLAREQYRIDRETRHIIEEESKLQLEGTRLMMELTSRLEKGRKATPEKPKLTAEEIATLEELERRITKKERQLAEIKAEKAAALVSFVPGDDLRTPAPAQTPDTAAAPAERNLEQELAQAMTALQGMSRYNLFNRGKRKSLERKITGLEINIDKNKNPFKHFLIDKMSPRTFEILFGKNREGATIENLNIFGEQGELRFRIFNFFSPLIDYTIEFSSNGFMLQLQNPDITKDEKEPLMREDAKAVYKLISPSLTTIAENVGYEEGVNLMRQKAREYQEVMSQEFLDTRK